MKALWLIFLLFAASVAQAQTLRVVPIKIQGDDQFPKTIRFFCTQKYPRKRCVRDAITLQLVLRTYPVVNLGSWNFVLASSDEWTDLVHSLGGVSGSPAFSVLESRTTVFEEALFSAFGRRRAELILMFGTVDRILLEQAVTHELGHILCKDANEIRAAQNGQDLLAGRTWVCQDSKQRLYANAKPH